MAYSESIGHVIDDVTWPWKVKVRTSICLRPIISKMAGDTDSITIQHLQETAPWVSNGHVTVYLTWWKVKVMAGIYLDADISKRITDSLGQTCSLNIILLLLLLFLYPWE